MKTLWHTHKPLMTFAAAMTALIVVSIVGLLVDDRSLVGAPLWAKPFKFAVSFVIYSVTWTWLLSLQTRWRRLGGLLGTVIAIAGVIEMAIIVGQQVRGHRSHFNLETPFDTAMWVTMGTTIGILFIANVVWTVLLWREPLLDGAIAWALRLGAVISLAGLAVAFLMTSPTPTQLETMTSGEGAAVVGSHSVGVEDGGPALPLLGWSTTGGDLRIAHFVGMHGLQLVPLFVVAGIWLLRLRSEREQSALVLTVAGGYAGLVAIVTDQALRGEPLIAPGVQTLASLGLLMALVAVGLVATFSLGRREAVAAR